MNHSLHAYHLRVRATATGPLELHEHTGASLRGAFFGALWGRFCTNKQAPTCAACPLVQVCPVSTLVAPLRDEATRGRDVPRPYAIKPPVGHARTFGPGDGFEFGLTLFGSAWICFRTSRWRSTRWDVTASGSACPRMPGNEVAS